MGAGILAVILTLLASVGSGARRQAAHAEGSSDLLAAAALVRDALGRDLLEAGSPPALPPGTSGALDLPGDRTWAWDPDARVLRRAGRAVVREGLAEVRFRWLRGFPEELEVTLVRDEGVGAAGTFVLRFAAPPSLATPAGWTRAPET